MRQHSPQHRRNALTKVTMGVGEAARGAEVASHTPLAVDCRVFD